MYQMTILLARQQGQLILQFKQKAAADMALDTVRMAKAASPMAPEQRLTLLDDYSRAVDLAAADIVATVMLDCAEGMKGAGDAKLIEVRANAQLQKTVAADPVLKLLGPMQIQGVA